MVHRRLLLLLTVVIQQCRPLHSLTPRQVRPLSESSMSSEGPSFDLETTANVTAFKDVPTELVCRVRNLGNHTVSWIRLRDTSLLTVGRYTYTTDLRFEAVHEAHHSDWIVRLRRPKKRDEGFYECQIATTPHRSALVHLTVLEPQTRIVGQPDIFVDERSMINITCYVTRTHKPPSKVRWLKDQRQISFRGPRQGVSLIVEKGSEETRVALLMQDAVASDSAVYECLPDNAPRASVKVHVLVAGEMLELKYRNHVAGLQTNEGVVVAALHVDFITQIALLLFFYVLFLH